MTVIHSSVLGELNHQHQKNVTYFSLPYAASGVRSLSCILLDDKGRSVWEGTLNKTSGRSTIEFQIKGLKAGLYHFWIEVEGKMTVQSVQIARPQKAGLKKLFKNYFN